MIRMLAQTTRGTVVLQLDATQADWWRIVSDDTVPAMPVTSELPVLLSAPQFRSLCSRADEDPTGAMLRAMFAEHLPIEYDTVLQMDTTDSILLWLSELVREDRNRRQQQT